MAIDKLSAALLGKYEGLGIDQICTNGFTKKSDNHCAHFVNHVLSLSFGYTCKGATGKTGAAANLRVQETFAKCPQVGKWADRGATVTKCFAFITYASSVDLGKKTMVNRPNKHIGIYCDGNIWHYSNSQDKVVKQTPDEFAKHYSGSGYAVFYGTFPTDAEPVARP
jgi:hypothetical protein